MEAVVGPTSLLIGQTPQSLHLRQNFEVNLLAVRETKRSRLVRLGQRRFEPGDVVVLQGQTSQLASALDRLALLPLAERNLSIARPRPRVLPLLILIAAIVLIACRVVTVELGFFVAATVTLLLRLITVREAYETVDWPVIVMLGCLIPVGESLRDGGAACRWAYRDGGASFRTAGGGADPCCVDAGDALPAPRRGGGRDGTRGGG